MLYAALSGSMACSSSICSWLALHGTPAARCSAEYTARGMGCSTSLPLVSVRPSASAKPAMVGVANSCDVGTLRPVALRTRIISFAACTPDEHTGYGGCVEAVQTCLPEHRLDCVRKREQSTADGRPPAASCPPQQRSPPAC